MARVVVVQPLGSVSAMATVPVNPSLEPVYIVAPPCEPAVRDISDGLAYTLKSGLRTCIVTFAEWVIDPLVPVIVTLYFPG